LAGLAGNRFLAKMFQHCLEMKSFIFFIIT